MLPANGKVVLTDAVPFVFLLLSLGFKRKAALERGREREREGGGATSLKRRPRSLNFSFRIQTEDGFKVTGVLAILRPLALGYLYSAEKQLCITFLHHSTKQAHRLPHSAFVVEAEVREQR